MQPVTGITLIFSLAMDFEEEATRLAEEGEPPREAGSLAMRNSR
jgi:hypothetical protein